MAYPALGRSSAVTAAVAAILGAGGCTDDTGLIVEVNGSVQVDRLDFAVGTGAIETGWLMDPAASPMSVDVAGRDLANDPYQLMVRDGAPGDPATTVMVAVVGYLGGQEVAFGAFDQPQAFVEGKVILREITLVGDPYTHVTTTGCVFWSQATIVVKGDRDCDGDGKDVDCNDENSTIGPSQPEICDNGVSDDCDAEIDETEDVDGDGKVNCEDCDDADPMTYPGAPELCDHVDNDCNGFCDDGNLDLDQDNINTCGDKIKSDGTCEPIGVADCNDQDGAVNPFATEVCDGIDNDCSGGCDDADGIDVDEDGFSDCGTMPPLCGPPLSDFVDCDDSTGEIRPFADEICDGKDNDCDGSRLEGQPCYGWVTEGGSIPVCTLGRRGCDDEGADGSAGWLDGCVFSVENVAVPDAACEAYAACESAIDPWTCANTELAGATATCDVYHVGGLLCAPRQQTLPPTAADACIWSVIGGMEQEHWVVGVAGTDGTASESITSCFGTFVVLDKRDVVPQPDELFLHMRSFDAISANQLVHVILTPAAVPECPETGGMHCTVVASP